MQRLLDHRPEHAQQRQAEPAHGKEVEELVQEELLKERIVGAREDQHHEAQCAARSQQQQNQRPVPELHRRGAHC